MDNKNCSHKDNYFIQYLMYEYLRKFWFLYVVSCHIQSNTYPSPLSEHIHYFETSFTLFRKQMNIFNICEIYQKLEGILIKCPPYQLFTGVGAMRRSWDLWLAAWGAVFKQGISHIEQPKSYALTNQKTPSENFVLFLNSW